MTLFTGPFGLVGNVEAKLILYEVMRDVPGMGACSMGLYKTVARAEAVRDEWNAKAKSKWDHAWISKREVND